MLSPDYADFVGRELLPTVLKGNLRNLRNLWMIFSHEKTN